ncbi:MAG TPA: hypothetical protein VFE55_11665 [Acidimicrobiia bacterium]|nr:hypothetical protein [Acidimicrobiia bacterium]
MRRVRRLLAVVLVVAGTVALAVPGRGQAAGDAGPAVRKSPVRTEPVGSASARVAAAGPIVGGLNLEAGFGRATVDLSGDAARGESATMSAGSAGLFLSLAGAPPVLPDPTRADSTGTADAERSVAAPAGDFVRLGHEKAHAEPRRSEARTGLGDLAVGPAAVLGGTSTAAINEEGASSSSAVGELRLGGAGGPAVVLSGLTWRAAQPKGAPGEAAFSIGAATIAGQPLAVGSPEQIAAAIEAANGALGSQGIRISAPVVAAGPDGGRVGPLRVELRDPPLNRAVAGAAYGPLAPTVSQAQDEAVKASGSDPRVSQALLGANVALSLVLGNGGVGVEVGGATADLTTREVPDLDSLLGGSRPAPLPGAASGGSGGPAPAGSDGAAGGPEQPDGAAGGAWTGGDPPAGYAALPPAGGLDTGGGTAIAAPATAAPPPVSGTAPGSGGSRRSPARPPGHLPAPLAAAGLATGFSIAGADWLGRRRTVGLVGGLRAAAGLGTPGRRPARRGRRLVALGVAAGLVLGLALAPSRVPLRSRAGDELASSSPLSAGDGAPVQTGVPSDPGPSGAAAAGAGGASGAAAAAGAGANAATPATGPAGRVAVRGANPAVGTAAGPRPGAATGVRTPAPGGRTATSTPGGAAGAVTRGRDCPGGELQDKNSTYSPPCLDFSGDNGGATSRGVTADTVTVAMREPELIDAGVNNQGRITDTPADLKRSLLAFVDYFNRVYQTYGRKVQVVFYKAKTPLLAGAEGGHQEEANADALTVSQEIKAFADLAAMAPSFADALARQGVIGYGTYHLSKTWYQAHAPYAWASLPDCTWIAEQSIDYVVKRLGTAPARYAGDPAMRTKPRAIGLVVPDSPWYQECADHAEELYRAAGYHFARRVNYPLNFNQSSQTATNVVAQMKAAGVTTVMCMCDPLLPYFATPQANQQDYHPEWLVAGFGATDTDIAGQFYDQAQWSHAFGMGVIGELKSGYASESYRAYKAIRNDEPAQLRDVEYFPLLWFFSCLQMAGPNLNPKTFEAGCFALPPHQGEIGLWKFGPGDYTAVSDAREIYWDPEAVSPWNNRKGRYLATMGGQRFSGPWPAGEPSFPPPK